MSTIVSVFIIGLFLGFALCDRLNRRQKQRDLAEAMTKLDKDITRVGKKFADIREGR